MRKTVLMACATGALLFSGAGAANATVGSALIPTSTTTTVAAPDDNNHHDSDKTGLWGLAGLVGLVGLVGLKRRNDPNAVRTGATPGRGPGAGI